MQNTQDQYDVAIVGAGITGSALLYLLSKYTNVGKVVLVEKYSGPAQVSSKSTNNSQTLHFGDIETNYTVEKAGKVKLAAEMVVRYLEEHAKENEVYRIMPKMVLAVGKQEVEVLERRYEEFRSLFPGLLKLESNDLWELEPKVMEGRDPNVPVSALYTEKGYVMDFGKLAESFIENAEAIKGRDIDIRYTTPLRCLREEEGGFSLDTPGGVIRAKTVVVAAGAHSLTIAHSLGYGCDLTLIPVAGNFYTAKNMLRGKVYTIQHKKLPFAAIHGDPEVTDTSQMRFGPIAKAVPVLEPRNLRSVLDFFRVFRVDWDAIVSVVKINTDPVILRFIFISFFYDWPIIGKPLFLKQARKIVPTIQAKDLTYARGLGGIRPQVVNRKKHAMQLGEVKIVGKAIIFNITPSPGASVCLKNAADDMRMLVEFLGDGYMYDEAAFARDLLH